MRLVSCVYTVIDAQWIIFGMQVCKEAAMGPLRELNPEMLRTVRPEEVRSIHEQVTAPVCF